MSSPDLMRWGGLAAILAGILRSVNAVFPPDLLMAWREILYLLNDLFILFGLMGLYGFQQEKSGWWGFGGFLLAMTGTGIIIL
jgi:hypothetical protein